MADKFSPQAIENLDPDMRRLVRMARKARSRAYAPYSKYLVGCVVIDSKGGVHSGCNVENSSYSVSICAERTALAKMVSRGIRDCRKIIVVTSSEEPSFPCGICRQMIQELGPRSVIYAVNRRGSLYCEIPFSELYPLAFSKEKLTR